jgi:hypothetical protein
MWHAWPVSQTPPLTMSRHEQYSLTIQLPRSKDILGRGLKVLGLRYLRGLGWTKRTRRWFKVRSVLRAKTTLKTPHPAPCASTLALRTPASFRPAKRPHSDSFNDSSTYRAGKHESPTRRGTTPTPETADWPETPDTPLSTRSSELPSAPTIRTTAIAVEPAPVPVLPREPEVTVKKEEPLAEPDISGEIVPSSPERPHASQSLAPPPPTEITLSPSKSTSLTWYLVESRSLHGLRW